MKKKAATAEKKPCDTTPERSVKWSLTTGEGPYNAGNFHLTASDKAGGSLSLSSYMAFGFANNMTEDDLLCLARQLCAAASQLRSWRLGTHE